MKINRVRRVGNSKVLSLPRELERVGFIDGAQVVIQELPSGEVRLLPADNLRVMVRQYGRRVVAENRKALDILAEHDQKLSERPT
jgi:antitoxin component of MazEF toxin-antitoxin module